MLLRIMLFVLLVIFVVFSIAQESFVLLVISLLLSIAFATFIWNSSLFGEILFRLVDPIFMWFINRTPIPYDFCIYDDDVLLYRQSLNSRRKHIIHSKMLRHPDLFQSFRKFEVNIQSEQVTLIIHYTNGNIEEYTGNPDSYQLPIKSETNEYIIGISPPKKTLILAGAVSGGKLYDMNLRSQPESSDHVGFCAYAPKVITKSKRYGIVVYAYRPDIESDAIKVDANKFVSELGENPKVRQTKDTVQIERESHIEVVPVCEGISFEPRSMMKTWEGEWVRYLFDFRVPEEYEDDELWIRISIRINNLEIANLKTSCEIITADTEQDFQSPTLPDNPLAHAYERGNMSLTTAKPYRNIFISYSRKDSNIVHKRASEIERVLGDNVFLDVKSLHAGNDWQYKLAEAIQKADVFYLFWSENSAQSEYCRYEWMFALDHKCRENRCVDVIRPVYWDGNLPNPNPPSELSHLHFEPIDINTEISA